VGVAYFPCGLTFASLFECEHLGEARLSGAGLADDAEYFPLLDGEVHVRTRDDASTGGTLVRSSAIARAFSTDSTALAVDFRQPLGF
jgi:hypothetical protein